MAKHRKKKGIVATEERVEVWEWMYRRLINGKNQGWIWRDDLIKAFGDTSAFRNGQNTAHWLSRAFRCGKILEREPIESVHGGRQQYKYRILPAGYLHFLKSHDLPIPSFPASNPPKPMPKPRVLPDSIQLLASQSPAATPKTRSSAISVVPSELQLLNPRGEVCLTLPMAQAEAVYEFMKSLHEART